MWIEVKDTYDVWGSDSKHLTMKPNQSATFCLSIDGHLTRTLIDITDICYRLKGTGSGTK